MGKLPSGPLRPLSRPPPPLNFPSLMIIPTLSHTAFAQAAIRPQDWHFVATDQAPLLDGLGSALAHASLVDYLHTRDASRATRGAPAAGTSVSLAAKAWKLSQRGIARRGGKVRHLWDLRWHGANQAVANPGLAEVLGVCPLCGHGSCSKTHILCNCPGIADERASLHHDLTLLAGRTPRGPRHTLVRAFQRLLFHEPGIANRGQL